MGGWRRRRGDGGWGEGFGFGVADRLTPGPATSQAPSGERGALFSRFIQSGIESNAPRKTPGVTIRADPRRGSLARSRRSLSPVTRKSVWPANAADNNLSSFGSRDRIIGATSTPIQSASMASNWRKRIASKPRKLILRLDRAATMTRWYSLLTSSVSTRVNLRACHRCRISNGAPIEKGSR